MGAQNPDEDNLPDEPLDGDDNQITGTLTSQIPERAQVAKVSNTVPTPAAAVIAPPTGGRKVSANGELQLAYIVFNNELHSLRPDEFDALDLNDLEGSMKGRRTLKHSPTNVHGKGELRRSDEDRRPMFYVKEGKLVRMETTPFPTKVATVKGDKTAKVSKGNGPNIIYIDDRRYVKENGGSHLYSINAAQFSDVMSGKVKLDGHKILIHLPTCVTRDGEGFLHSSQPDRRPMYRYQVADVDAGIEEGIIPIDVLETPVAELSTQQPDNELEIVNEINSVEGPDAEAQNS